MSLLQLYVGKEIIKASMLATIGLLSFILLIVFVDEMGRTGRGGYDSVEAILYVAATIPRHVYHIFPPAVLIGTMIGLGVLATHGELVAMRAAGITRMQIVRIVMGASLVLTLFSVLLGEFVAPVLDSYAETRRSLAINGGKALKTTKGVWVRDERDYVRISTVLKDGHLQGVQIFRIGKDARLQVFLYAQKAVFQKEGEWLLYDVESTQIQKGTIERSFNEQQIWRSGLSPDLMQAVVIKPEVMAAKDLLLYSGYLQENGIDARKYWLAFWGKIATPFATLVMAILAIPFVLVYRRNVSTGNRVLLGTILGVSFYILNQFTGHASLVYAVPPLIGAFFPSLVFLVVAMVLFKKMQ